MLDTPVKRAHLGRKQTIEKREIRNHREQENRAYWTFVQFILVSTLNLSTVNVVRGFGVPNEPTRDFLVAYTPVGQVQSGL